jgi:hypothetical protein
VNHRDTKDIFDAEDAGRLWRTLEKMKEYNNYKYSELTEKIIKAARRVLNELGHGFVEKAYENALSIELKCDGIPIEQQKNIAVYYKGDVVGEFTADLIVDRKIIVELKVTDIEVGLLINFGDRFEVRRKVFSAEYKSATLGIPGSIRHNEPDL